MPAIRKIPTSAHQTAIKLLIARFGSQEKMAEFLGVDQSNISNWLLGKNIIPFRHAEKLVEKFPVTIWDLRPDLKKYKEL